MSGLRYTPGPIEIFLAAGLSGLALTAWSVYYLVRGLRTLRWSHVEGIITESAVVCRRERMYHTPQSVQYTPKVRYRYQVAGENFYNDLIALGNMWHGEAWAASIVKQYPVGARIRVYYDQDQPSSAILAPGVPVGPVFWFGVFGALILYICIASYVAWG